MTSDLENKATAKARTVDPRILPFPTFASNWQTWVGDAGQWIFIEKEVVETVAAAFTFDREQACNWVGARILDWLKDPKNASRLKPREIWNFSFAGRKDMPVQFGVFQNQCFVFMPRKT